MSKCNAVYFCKGWENARGCRIEHETAKAYGFRHYLRITKGRIFMNEKQKKMKITFIDLFCGIGGFRLGMEMAGHICLGHCER